MFVLCLPAETAAFCFAVTVADAGLVLRMPLGGGESSVADGGGLTCDDGWRGWVDCTGLLDFRKLFPVKKMNRVRLMLLWKISLIKLAYRAKW